MIHKINLGISNARGSERIQAYSIVFINYSVCETRYQETLSKRVLLGSGSQAQVFWGTPFLVVPLDENGSFYQMIMVIITEIAL